MTNKPNCCEWKQVSKIFLNLQIANEILLKVP